MSEPRFEDVSSKDFFKYLPKLVALAFRKEFPYLGIKSERPQKLSGVIDDDWGNWSLEWDHPFLSDGTLDFKFKFAYLAVPITIDFRRSTLSKGVSELIEVIGMICEDAEMF